MKIILSVLIGLVVFAVGGLFFLGQKSRTGTPLGLINGALAPCPDKPNCENSEGWQSQDENVAPLPQEAWEKIADAVTGLGGEIVTTRDDYIAATFTSSIFGFVDDVEFRKAADMVHVRSGSRVGHSDMGANRKRVEALRAAMAV